MEYMRHPTWCTPPDMIKMDWYKFCLWQMERSQTQINALNARIEDLEKHSLRWSDDVLPHVEGKKI